MPSKQLLSLKKDSPLPLDTRLNPITVEQQKLNQEIQDFAGHFGLDSRK